MTLRWPSRRVVALLAAAAMSCSTTARDSALGWRPPPARGSELADAEWLDGPRGIDRVCARLRARDGTSRAYLVDVPPQGFTFRGYDFIDERLTVANDQLTVGDGTRLHVPSAWRDQRPSFAVDASSAAMLLRDRQEGRLGLRVAFRAAAADACVRSNDGHVAIAVQVLSASLVRADAAVVARAVVSP